VVSELTNFVFSRGKTKDSCDLNSSWTDRNNATEEMPRETYV
jgi:hypothetical protein